MVSEFLLDGVEIKTSTKSDKEYAVFYVREIRNGEPVIRQSTFNSFNSNVVDMAKSGQLSAKSIIQMDLRVFEATVADILLS